MSSEPPPPPQPPTHQTSVGLLDTQQSRDRSPSPLRGNVVPSPLPTRRTRTFSATVRASQGPVYKGVCKCFCRSKGHGFITPADGGPDIFLHISDVEGEYVPVEGDEVTYKMCSIPPKNEKLQAVEVVITHLAPGTKHETCPEPSPWPRRAQPLPLLEAGLPLPSGGVVITREDFISWPLGEAPRGSGRTSDVGDRAGNGIQDSMHIFPPTSRPFLNKVCFVQGCVVCEGRG
uniref:Calcium regulated heat stable protein 1 n=1 Tax=Canis lupus familiaris TaxID=9615 RepID=A0A8P0PPA4_CANLF